MTIENLEIKQSIDEIKEEIQEIWNKIYPVGSIYMSVNSTSPETLFGGEWVSWGQGKFPIGVDPSDETGHWDASDRTGGSLTHHHFNGVYSINNTQLTVSNKNAAGAKSIEQAYTVDGATGFTSFGGTAAGYGYATEDAEVQPPFYTVYMWKRTG